MRRASAIFAIIAAIFFSSRSYAFAADEAPSACFTQPWMSGIASFLVGTTVKVVPLNSWAQNGALKRASRRPPGAPIIALDPKDAVANGASLGSSDLHLLYENFPIRDVARMQLFFDPSVMPFLSQRMMIALSGLWPENYAFYQRRLAEFQSRLESTLEVGRSLVAGERFLDLTGAVGSWVRAASVEMVRPPADVWGAWSSGMRLDELEAALSEARSRGLRVITDAWTPQQVMRVAANRPRVHIDAPTSPELDLFAYLSEIHLRVRAAQ